MTGLLLPICSVFFSALLCFVFFSKQRVNLLENKMYAIMIVLGLIDSIVAAYLQTLPFSGWTSLELKLVTILNTIDFFLVMSYDTCLFIYIMLISFPKLKQKAKKLFMTCAAVNTIAMIFILFSDIDIISQNGNYSIAGSAVLVTYVMVGIYLFSSIIVALVNYDKIDRRHIPIFAIIPLLIIVFLVFQINPYLTIISIVQTFVGYIMFFTIENPDVQMMEQLRIAKETAEKANRAKTDFLSSMSHEIRTPLNAIVGLSEDIVSYKDQVPVAVVEDSYDIQNASQTLLEIVGNILDISKIESDKMEIKQEPYNFVEEISTLAKVTSTRIGEKPIDFKMKFAEDIPYELIGDKIHVKTIINNLLTNAFKYTDKGEVNFNVKCINDEDVCNLIICVLDTGRGIKSQDINKLFSKFERLETEKNSTTEGTGLGLAITKKLVTMMGGTINVQSKYGVGSLFIVKLPQKIGKMTAPVSVNDLSDTVIGSKEFQPKLFEGKRVLIVDDNKLNIKVAKRALQDFNFEFDEAENGEVCLEKVKDGSEFDLILMDIMMPVMSGETAFKHLKQIEGFKIPVIAMTADAIAGAKEKYLSQGFEDYIAKPFKKDEIKEKLEKIFK